MKSATSNAIDAFFAQIQGSVRVRLEDGSMLRLNYDAQNGHPYTAVGRFLIERKIFTREEISMQKIREWMEANPEEGKALRRENKSFVFFRETPLGAEDEPPGAQGIALTPGRSIAVDRNLHTYGMPFFIDAVLPIQSEKPDTKFRRLMIAQDTGGAIIGPARADIYLGAGDEAARAAGRFKQFGRFVMLVPNELDPGAARARDVPLPLPRPKIDGPIQVVERREEPAPAPPSRARPMTVARRPKSERSTRPSRCRKRARSRKNNEQGRGAQGAAAFRRRDQALAWRHQIGRATCESVIRQNRKMSEHPPVAASKPAPKAPPKKSASHAAPPAVIAKPKLAIAAGACAARPQDQKPHRARHARDRCAYRSARPYASRGA